MGKLLDYRRYLLYTYQSVSQPGLHFPVINSSKTIKTDKSKEKIDNPNRIDSLDKEEEVPFNKSPNIKTEEFDVVVKSNFMNEHMLSASNVSNSILYKESMHEEKLNENQQLLSNASKFEEVTDTKDINITPAILQSTKTDNITDGECTEKEINNKSRASTKTASDPTFLEEFYNNSRLHLISTLGAEYKQLVNQLREKSDGKFSGLEKLKAKGML